MKKIVLSLLVLLATISVKAYDYINYNGIEMTRSEYDNLIALGFNEKEINTMDLETFNKNKNLIGRLDNYEEAYIRTTTTVRNGITVIEDEIISEETYLQEKDQNTLHTINNRGYVIMDYKKITYTISYLSNLNHYRYKASLEWLSIPTNRSYDILGIGIDSDYISVGYDTSFNQQYTKASNGGVIVTYSYYPHTLSTGSSATFKLTTTDITELSSYYYFDVMKINNNQTLTYLVSTAAYCHSHDVISYNVALNHTFSKNTGIILSSSNYTHFDPIINVSATWTGNW